MQQEQETILDRIFEIYRELTGDIESSPYFLANIWRGIELRKQENRSWMTYLVAWSPRLAIASAAVALLLIASVWIPFGASNEVVLLDSSYVDVLAQNSMDEQDDALWRLASNVR
jgi:hypothetical protein